MRRPRCHQYAPARKRSGRAQHHLDSGSNLHGFGHAAETGLAAFGHVAAVGADNVNAIGAKLRQIALGRLGGPHVRIHRRRQQDRLVGCKQHGGRKIVGVAASHFRQQVGSGGRNNDQIGIARQPDMADIEFALCIEQIRVDAFPGQRAGGQRGHEMLRGLREHAAHAQAAILQTADEIERLIGRDAAADDEKDAPGVGLGSERFLRRRMAGRLELFEHVAAGIRGRCFQDDAHFVFHRATVPRRAQAEQRLELIVKLADGETGHRPPPDRPIIMNMIAVQSMPSQSPQNEHKQQRRDRPQRRNDPEVARRLGLVDLGNGLRR